MSTFSQSNLAPGRVSDFILPSHSPSKAHISPSPSSSSSMHGSAILQTPVLTPDGTPPSELPTSSVIVSSDSTTSGAITTQQHFFPSLTLPHNNLVQSDSSLHLLQTSTDTSTDGKLGDLQAILRELETKDGHEDYDYEFYREIDRLETAAAAAINQTNDNR